MFANKKSFPHLFQHLWKNSGKEWRPFRISLWKKINKSFCCMKKMLWDSQNRKQWKSIDKQHISALFSSFPPTQACGKEQICRKKDLNFSNHSISLFYFSPSVAFPHVSRLKKTGFSVFLEYKKTLQQKEIFSFPQFPQPLLLLL